MDEGEGQGGKRRQWTRMEEERLRLDKESHWLANITGDESIRQGAFLINNLVADHPTLSFYLLPCSWIISHLLNT